MGIHFSSYVTDVAERVGSTFIEALAANLTGGVVLFMAGADFTKSALGLAGIQALYALAKCLGATALPPKGSPALFGATPKGVHSMGATGPDSSK